MSSINQNFSIKLKKLLRNVSYRDITAATGMYIGFNTGTAEMNSKLQTMCAAVALLGASMTSAHAVGFVLSPGGSAGVLGNGGLGTFNPQQPGGPGYPFNDGEFNPDNLPQVNDAITIFDSSTPGGLNLNFGAGAGAGLAVSIDVTYWGKEAGYTNGAFETVGAQTFNTASSTPPVTGFGLFGCIAGPTCLLDYQFTTSGGGGKTAKNGAIDPGLRIGYFIDQNAPVSPDGVQSIFALFDDGGAGPDSDFDDMIIQFSISPNAIVVPTPLPAPLVLFLTGLLGLGFLGRFRSKRQLGSETTA